MMGQLIKRGGVPYVDLFDNKGILIYLINYWGLLLGQYGILLLEIANLIGTLLCWERICILYGLRKVRYVVLLMSLLIMLRFFCSGNLTEEWSLLPISLSLFLFLKSQKSCNYQATSFQFILFGSCMAAAFNLRANNVVPILSIGIWWFVSLCRNYRAQAFRALLDVSVGFFSLTILFVLFMFVRGGWNGIYEMYYSSIYFNIGYALHYNANIGTGIWSYISLGYWGVNVFLVLLPTFFLFNKEKQILFPIIFAMGLSIMTMGRSMFIHYQMLLVPLVVVCISLFTKHRQWLALVLIGVFFARFSAVSLATSYAAYQETDINREFVEEFGTFYTSIPEYERDQVWNYTSGNSMDAFCKVGYIPCNRFILPLGMDLSDRFDKEETGKLIDASPKWIILDDKDERGSFDELDYIDDHYRLLFKTQSRFRTNLLIYCQTKG